jgi:hypothetical protein
MKGMKWVNWLIPKDISTSSSSIVKKILVDLQKELSDQFNIGTYCAHRIPISMRSKDIVYNGKNQLFTSFSESRIYFHPIAGYFVYTKDKELYKMKVGDVFFSINSAQPRIVMDSSLQAWYYQWVDLLGFYKFGQRIV